MLRSCRRAIIRVLACAIIAGPTVAQAETTGVVIESPGHPPFTVSVADLRALPATDVTVSFETGHGKEQATWRGALLWTVLARAGAVDPTASRDHVRQTVTTAGQDGYTSVLALAEPDPAFEGKPVILAYDRDGKPLGGDHPRLIVPGDRRGGRSVRDVVRISVR